MVADCLLTVWVFVRIGRNGWQSPGLNYWLLERFALSPGQDPDEVVTIGWYRNYLPAEVHRIRLECMDVPCVLFGTIISRVYSYIQFGYPIVIPVELRVRAQDAQRALEALNTAEPDAERELDAMDFTEP
jgi:hypothetical protein